MRPRTDRTRSVLRGRLAAVGVGVLLTTASVVPATAAQADSTTTVHGTVRSGSTNLAGVPVGFWSRTGHRLAAATTSATGAFTLRVPSGMRGYAYAGTRPDATNAIFGVRGASYVRGVIGATQDGTTSYPLAQGHASATAADLAGGATLRFALQQPGRVRVDGGTSLEDDGSYGTVELLRLDGSRVDLPRPAPGGVFTSKPVVPGNYAVHSVPVTPYLPQTTLVTVRAGQTTTISPAFAAGATVSGTITSNGKPAAGVPVTAVQGGRVVRNDATDASGHYALRAVPSGDYRLRVGYNVQPDREQGLESEVDQPQASSDDYLPTTRDFTVTADHAPVALDVSVLAAGHLKGTVTGLGREEAPRVWVEDAAHRIVRTEIVGLATIRRYELGGLVPGRAYTVYSATYSGSRTDATYGVATFTATAGTVSRNLAVTKRTLTLRGVASGAARGTVTLRARGTALPLLARSGKVDATGHYVVRGLIPGAYERRVVPADARVRLASRWHPLTLTRSTTRNLGAGPRPGRYRARFLSGAAPVSGANSALGSAADRAGDLMFLYTDATGRSRDDTVHPGVYRYASASAEQGAWNAAPAADGPWWFGAPTGSFTITAGRTTDVGTVALHVHGG